MGTLGDIDFLEARQFPQTLIEPLREARQLLMNLAEASKRQGKPGRRPMADDQASRAAFAAATVTILSRKGKGRSVKDALKLVSKASRLDIKWLGQFRLNLLRGNGASNQLAYYKLALAKLEIATSVWGESDQSLLEYVSRQA